MSLPAVSHLTVLENSVFLNEEWLRNCTDNLGQFIIVDCGCPRSLMGDEEYYRLKEMVEVKEIKVKEEGFRFGPSRIYNSNKKVKFSMRIGMNQVDCEFFVVKGKVPILLGNDFMAPLGGNIDMDENSLVLKKIDMEIPLEKTKGGHFVIPVSTVTRDVSQNVKGEEADALMLLVLENVENEDIKAFHDNVGHSIFLSLALEADEESKVKKVHRYFGHRSSRKVWDLFNKANKLRGKKQAVFDVIDQCKTCSAFRKSPPRPKVGMPPSSDFNEIVGLDLKVVNKNKGEYILWIVDLFSKMIKGKYIKNKLPATIIEGIISTWIVGDGIGPGHPSKGFWSDNGGEFLNNEVLDFAAAMDVEIKMTSADSPHQNGVVERHHATADIIFEKLITDNPTIDRQEAVNQAAFAKNTDTNQTGFSPIQLMTGTNPKFPGLAESNPASSNMKGCNKYMKTLKTMDYARTKMREIDCDSKLKKALSQRINPNVERFYRLGDPVFFYDEKKREWKKATALIRLGKTLYLRFGNFLKRVAIEKVRPDLHGEAQREEGYDEHDIEADKDTAKFSEEETPVDEMVEDLAVAEKNKDLETQITDLQARLDTLTEENNKLKPKIDIENENDLDIVEKQVEEKERVALTRKDKRKAQKIKKQAARVKVPKTGDDIIFKETDSSEDWKSGRVVGSWKKNSKYQYWKHLLLNSGLTVEKDFENGIAEWKLESEVETDDDSEDGDAIIDDQYLDQGAFPVQIIPPKDYDIPEVQDAIKAEIAKFRSFNAFKEVEDEGQRCIPIKWVVTDQRTSGKNEPIKARMCIRGDLERGKEEIRTDSPTASKEAIKLALIVAANEGFKVKSGDIKSAYLQGELIKRKVFIRPPKEAQTSDKLWLLLQGAYGLVDGGRLFYLKLSEKLTQLGMHKVHSDGALFTYVKNDKLQGIITTHSDDLILAGNDVFEEDIESKLKDMFQFSKIEEDSFKYCGCNIRSKEDGIIEMEQNYYMEELEEIEAPNGDDSDKLSYQEIRSVRKKIGELLWISLMT